MKKEHHFNKLEAKEFQKQQETEKNSTTEAICDELEALKIENEKLKDELLRTLAESDNIKKRCALEIEKNNKYAISSFAKDLLAVADNLDRALDANQEAENTNCKSLLEGVELTRKELFHVFEKFGISKMESMDKPFDPNFHQVIQQVDDPSKPAGTVLAELQTGYMLNGRILREAMVVVSK